MCRLRNRSLLHNRLTTTKPFAAKQTRAPGTYSRFQKAFILTALKDQEEISAKLPRNSEYIAIPFVVRFKSSSTLATGNRDHHDPSPRCCLRDDGL